MAKIHLEIYTPNKKYLTTDVDFISFQSENFRLGILPRHQEMISNVVPCELILRNETEVFHYALSSGMVHVDKEKTTILVDSIEAPGEIDVASATIARDEALTLLHSCDDDKKRESIQKDLDLANFRLKVASNK
ncbi:MAG: ATP synthase F1 subunit epsilon [Coprobacillus sp.]|nr:ATP synthase F1 subunit epsilon [Coprobacillus sp.]